MTWHHGRLVDRLCESQETTADWFTWRRCADGPADADLAGPLGDRGQHDVHDADAADEQADARDGAQNDARAPLGVFGLASRASGTLTL